MDVWGPYKIPTCDDQKCFLTIVDDFSRRTWVFLLKLKSDAIVAIQQFISYVQTQFQKCIKTIRSDNGAEFINHMCTELLTRLGIVHQTSCSNTPQQNGIAERKHRHLLEVTRAIRLQAKYIGVIVFKLLHI